MDPEKLQAACELVDAMIEDLSGEKTPPSEDLRFYVNELTARLEARGKLKAARAILESLR